VQVTWKILLEHCPELVELRAGAASIAENEARPWYERWLPTSAVFSVAVGKAALRLGTSPDDVRPVALAGLVDAYRVAKQRLRRKGRNPRPAAVP
jgi:hypothetical protein